MKMFRSAILIAALSAMVVPAASAADFGVRAGRYDEGGRNFVGAEIDLPIAAGFSLNPNLEYVIEDDEQSHSGSLNADVLYRFTRSGLTPYLGVGAGIFRVDTPAGNSDTTVLNAIGGIGFDMDFLEPYAQIKYFRPIENDGEDNLAFVIGLRF